MEGATNVIIDAMTTGATAVSTAFGSIITSLLAHPVFVGLVGIGLAYGILKFALNRLPGVR